MRQTFFSVLISILMISTLVNAETVQLSFSGVTTEGRYCLLDSVKIENLTQNWSYTLDCSIDTTYDLPVAQVPTGIDNVAMSEDDGGLLSVSQNFAVGNTVVSINPIDNGIVRMRVMDMVGRVIIEHAEYLTAGQHHYILQLSTPQTYMIFVVTDSEHASAKILNMSSNGRYELSRISSLPLTNQVQSRRKLRAEGEDLMRYTGYTNQKGAAVSSEQITQYQSSPEHIVLRFAPVAKSQEGMYVGMMGFNSNLYPYSFDILTSSNLYAHQNFVSNLTMANGTILYHAVYTSLGNIVNAPVPEKLENVSIVTFTDGLDIGSWRMNSNYPSEALYLAAVNKQIHRTYIDGIKLDAYSIGVKGSDVTDAARFESDLHQLASDSANVFSVSNMEEVNARFREIAAKIYNTKVNYSMTIKLPAPDPGSIIRFTFDNVTDANNSIYYIEGTYDYDFNANMGILKDVVYYGVQCSDGTTWKSVPEGIFDIFTIHNIASNLGERLYTSSMRQWSYIPSTNNWQINSEFDPSSNSSTTEERTSALVMLVLDCSSSLSSDFSQMQSAANNFLSILAGSGNINKPTVASASVRLGDLQATLSASVVNTGNLSITGKGFCVSENPNMDNAVFYYIDAEDEFEYLLTDLIEGKTYYVCSFAENQLGRRYGYKISFEAIAYTVPALTTSSASNITISSATCGGTITSIGHTSIIEGGLCWSKYPTPTIEDTSKIIYTSNNSFSGTIDGLEDGTTYYVRAYAKNSKGIGYGNIETFTTIAIIPPTLTTSSVSNITTHSAQCGGTITDKGNSDILERGFCWSTNPNPTIEDTTLILGSGKGYFSGTIDGLEDGTTYYVRAYAKNTKEVGYGDEISFTTIAIVPPTVTTSAVSNITASSAQCGGSITNNGNSDIIERGLCWSTNPNPTIEDTTLILGSGMGNFNGTIDSLEDGTTYYIRAYAKNTKEIGYGEAVSFTTLKIVPPVVSLSSITVTNTAGVSCSGSITSDGHSPIIECGFCIATDHNPTIDDSTIVASLDNFSQIISDLAINKEYYVRAYAKNSKEIGYSSELSTPNVNFYNIITYTAESQLSEVTNAQESGLHTNAFNTSIKSHSFSNGKGIILFSEKLTSIGTRAFSGCKGITSVTIPNSVTSIGGYAFYGCSGLISIDIPHSVTSIGECAFGSCTGLTSIIFPNSVISIERVAFYSCTGLTSVTIPNSVTNIGERAFQYCIGLSSIEVENGNVVYDSRSNCNAIIETASNSLIVGCQNTIIPNSATSIGGYAFYGCSGLTSIEISNSVTSIGGYAFYGCLGLTSIEIPNSVTSIGSYAFYQCSGLTSVIIPNSVASIGDYAFYGCSGLISVTIPNGVTNIGEYAFYGCSGLTSVTIPNSVADIGSGAFLGCNSLPIIDGIRYADTYLVEAVDKTLSSYTIQQGTKWISTSAFYNCTSAKSIIIPNSVTCIEQLAFRNCSSLTSITIPSSVTRIGQYLFARCTALTSVIWNAKEVGDFTSSETPFYSFNLSYSLSNITKFTFGEDVIIIPAYICRSLQITSVTISKNVTSIHEGAFYNCSKITSITCKATVPPSIGSNVFYNVTKSIPVYVPAESVSAYKSATGWKNFTNIQAIK